jgi:hypothetical protein
MSGTAPSIWATSSVSRTPPIDPYAMAAVNVSSLTSVTMPGNGTVSWNTPSRMTRAPGAASSVQRAMPDAEPVASMITS